MSDFEKLNTLTEAAIAQHEMYVSWINAGFTPEQALDLLKTYIAEMIRGAAT